MARLRLLELECTAIHYSRIEFNLMIRHKAGYKYVASGVHAQVFDFPAAITCANDLPDARRLLAIALLDAAETATELGVPLPIPNPAVTNSEMDIEEPI